MSKIGTLLSAIAGTKAKASLINTNFADTKTSVNALYDDVGVLSTLATTAKTTIVAAINEIVGLYIKKNGTVAFTALQSYSTDLTPDNDKNLIPKKYADDTFPVKAGSASQTFKVADATAVDMALAIGQILGSLSSSAANFKIPINESGTIKTLIVKAGKTGSIATGATTTFAEAFPSACITVVACIANGANGTGNVASHSASGWVVNHKIGTNTPFNWVAIGY